MIFTLLGKLTLILLAALGLDGLLHRKWLLPTAAMWNAVLLAIVALPAAMLLVPQCVLPLMPQQTSEQTGPVAASQPINAERSTTPLTVAAGATNPAGPAVKKDLSDLNATIPPQGRTDGAPAISSTGVWTFALAMLVWVYGLGGAIALVRLLANLRAVNALRHRALPVTHGTWLARLEHWKGQLNLTESAIGKLLPMSRSPLRLLHSDRIEVPMALGATQRAIVIPSRMLANASLPTVDSILVHELAHLARADYAWQLLQRVVQAFLWFHPLWWISARRIAFIRERACDDFAVHALGDIEKYATTLLKLAEEMTRRHKLRLGLAVMRSTNLAHRLAEMQRSAGNKRYNASRPVRWAVGCSMAVVTILLGALSVGRAIAQVKEAPASDLTIEKLVRRLQQTVDKTRSYDVFLQAEYKWPLKTVIVPIKDPDRPAHREDFEWRTWESGETPLTEIHRSRQVRSSDGKRRVEHLSEHGAVVVFNGTDQRALHAAYKKSPAQGVIEPRQRMIEEGEEYEDYVEGLFTQSTLAQILAGRPSAHIASADDKGLVVIEAPAGEGEFNRQFGWRIWLDPHHGCLPAKYELRLAVDGKEPVLRRSVEIKTFKEMGDAAWVPVDLTSNGYISTPGPHFGEVGNIVHVTVDIARSRWNIDPPEDLFVLAFPPGVQVADLRRQQMFTTGDGDTGRDDQELLRRAKNKVSLGTPEPPHKIDLARVSVDERQAVAQLLKWGADITLAKNGSAKSVSFFVEPTRFPGRGGVNMYDDGMPQIGKLRHLRNLNLQNTGITDTGLSHLKELSELEFLVLENTKITDQGLRSLSALTALKRLYLDNNVFENGKVIKRVKVTDSGLVHLKELRSLEMLLLRGNDISDAGLEQLKSLPKLEQLELQNTSVTEAGVKALKDALPNLKYVSLGN